MNILNQARPFLKWAGGKGRLLEQFEHLFPLELKEGRITLYVEPFLGGGAVFFHVMAHYAVSRCFLSDINRDIIIAYRTIKDDLDALIAYLTELAQQYAVLNGEDRKKFYLRVRHEFNTRGDPGPDYPEVKLAARLIFLNRTCYNGLFRMNSKGKFNTPYGDYVNPRINDPENLRAVSRALKNVRLSVMDFGKIPELPADVKERAFFYLDPPYQPISRTSHFTAYSQDKFGSKEQVRLAGVFRELDRTGAKVMLSNSDPGDGLIRGLYQGFNIHIVQARRSINSKAERRGPLTELVITNY